MSDTKGGEPIFQVWGGGKKGGEPKFFQNLRRGSKANHTMYSGFYGIIPIKMSRVLT